MEYVYYILGFLVIYNLIKYFYKKSKQKELSLLYGDEFGRMIVNKKIGIGMNSEMLKKSWGRPDKVDGKVIRKNSIKEYYHYGKYKNKRGNTSYKYRLTMLNDTLDEIREN